MSVFKNYTIVEEKNCQLDLAVAAGDQNLVEKLLSAGEVDVNFSIDGKQTILHAAMIKNDVSMVKLLLSYNADVNLELNDANEDANSAQSPLCLALRQGNSEIAELLIRAGADVNKRFSHHRSGLTPLHVVASRRDTRLLQVLLVHGADPNARNDYGKSVLHYAVAAECPTETVEILLEHGARLDEPDAVNRTPLHSAIASGNADLVKFVIERGANAKAIHGAGKNSLHFAAQACREHLGVAKLLLEKGVPVNDVDRIHMCTPLHLALKSRYEKMARLLIHKGADIHASTRIGLTPLHFASQYGSSAIVKLLLARGADVAAKSMTGKTALHDACKIESESKIRILVEHGADINARDHEGRTPFQLLWNLNSGPARVMVKQMVRLELEGSPINEEDARVVRGHPSLRAFSHKCLEEIGRMKRVSIYNSVTFYYIFSKSPAKLAPLFNNSDFVSNLASVNYNMRFPLYARVLGANMRKAEERKNLNCKVEDFLTAAFCSYLPYTVMKEMSHYLSAEDLPIVLQCK